MEGEPGKTPEEVLLDPRPANFSGQVSQGVARRLEKIRHAWKFKSDSHFYAWLLEKGLYEAEQELLRGGRKASRSRAASASKVSAA